MFCSTGLRVWNPVHPLNAHALLYNHNPRSSRSQGDHGAKVISSRCVLYPFSHSTSCSVRAQCTGWPLKCSSMDSALRKLTSLGNGATLAIRSFALLKPPSLAVPASLQLYLGSLTLYTYRAEGAKSAPKTRGVSDIPVSALQKPQIHHSRAVKTPLRKFVQ